MAVFGMFLVVFCALLGAFYLPLYSWSVSWGSIRGCAMRERERKLARKRLDVEMRPYRQAGREKNPTNGLLRAVRQALRIPVPEIAAKMGVNRSVVFDLEAREPKNTITLKSMSRMAEAMGCMMVYGIVPVGGKTLDELAEERLWASLLGVGSEIRGQ
jgi:predicted DNA-binding mobile mystery protein A